MSRAKQGLRSRASGASEEGESSSCSGIGGKSWEKVEKGDTGGKGRGHTCKPHGGVEPQHPEGNREPSKSLPRLISSVSASLLHLPSFLSSRYIFHVTITNKTDVSFGLASSDHLSVQMPLRSSLSQLIPQWAVQFHPTLPSSETFHGSLCYLK